MSHQLPRKLELNTVCIMCSFYIYAKAVLFNLLKIQRSFSTGLCYRQLLFLAFLLQKPKLLGRFTLSGEGRKAEAARQSGGESPRLGRQWAHRF